MRQLEVSACRSGSGLTLEERSACVSASVLEILNKNKRNNYNNNNNQATDPQITETGSRQTNPPDRGHTDGQRSIAIGINLSAAGARDLWI